MSVVRDGRRSQLETSDSASLARPPSGAHYNFSSFEELVEWSGMLANNPPKPSGETGMESYVVQPAQLLSVYPRAYLYPRFIDAERAQHIIDLAKNRLGPSGLALKKGHTADNTQDVRTSSGTFLSGSSDPEGVLSWLEHKIALVTGIPAAYGEPFNVLRYDVGQHYDSHLDAFAEQDYGKQYSQRILTLLIYLNDVEEGGETVFLLEGKNGTARERGINYKSCSMGVKIKPRMGDVLLFWSANPDGSLDRHALHGGCPVLKGQKWVATKWIRNKCFGAC